MLLSFLIFLQRETILGGGIGGDVARMVMDAGLVAKIILSILFLFSVISWAIILYKTALFVMVRRKTNKFLEIFRNRTKIAGVYKSCVDIKNCPLASVLRVGYREFYNLNRILSQKSTNPNSQSNPREDVVKPDVTANVQRAMESAATVEVEKLEKQLSFLATTGSVSPFFGLLGTVWGVLDSFLRIGLRGSANITVVGPGVAEALITTVAGLAAAIPAVIAYNYFVSSLKTITNDINNFSIEFLGAITKESIL